jgi:hypothetical protein
MGQTNVGIIINNLAWLVGTVNYAERQAIRRPG